MPLRPPTTLHSKSKHAGVAWSVTAIASLAALVLWLPGCIPGCASCSDKPGCNGNQAVLCQAGVDQDGPDSYNSYFDCPSGTTCTERPGTGDQPVCVVGDGQPCDMTKEQQCVDGVPAACVSGSRCARTCSGSNSRHELRGLPRGSDLQARRGPVCDSCVSTSLGSCDKADAEACVHGVPAVCLALADNSLIWTASFTSYYDSIANSADGHCPSGSTCTQIGDTTDCVLDGDVACKRESLLEVLRERRRGELVHQARRRLVRERRATRHCAAGHPQVVCDD